MAPDWRSARDDERHRGGPDRLFRDQQDQRPDRPQRLRPRDRPVTMPIRVCLIGVTGFAHTHYTELTAHHEQGLARLVAATVINPAEVPDKVQHLAGIGCRVHRDFREMLAAWAGRADLCIVPTGIHWHAPMA